MLGRLTDFWTPPRVPRPGARGIREVQGGCGTLRAFIKSYDDLHGIIRDPVLPDPDARPS